MSVPPTLKKPSMVREIEALRIGPDEVLLLRFSEAIPREEVELVNVALEAGPLRGRVVCITAPEGEGVATVFET